MAALILGLLAGWWVHGLWKRVRDKRESEALYEQRRVADDRAIKEKFDAAEAAGEVWPR